ncbi:hypothetical protein D3C76_463160 [compost metagenome]
MPRRSRCGTGDPGEHTGTSRYLAAGRQLEPDHQYHPEPGYQLVTGGSRQQADDPG